jgi:low temperature requirement protein LtrA
MKAFKQILITFIVIYTGITLVMSISYLERYRAETIEQDLKIRELQEDLFTMETMYIKCAGGVSEAKGAHYVDGKLKFYKSK